MNNLVLHRTVYYTEQPALNVYDIYVRQEIKMYELFEHLLRTVFVASLSNVTNVINISNS